MKRADVEIAEEQENARRAGVEMKRYYRTGDVQKYLFVLEGSEDVHIEGVTIRNAPLWNVRLQDCDRVWVRGIHLYSDLERAVNSDGIDIVSSSNVTISDSTIVTADDAICLKTTALDPAPGRAVRPVANVLVTNCILGSSSTAMMIGTETHADIRHVVFSNIVVRDSNKVFGINVQDGGTVSDVRLQNITFETSRRHWNWWGGAEVMKLVLKKRSPDSKLGRIEHVTVDGASGTARGTSLVAGHAERMLEDITVSNLRVRMLPENAPDKRATHGLVFERVKGLALRHVAVEWDREAPEPLWESALVLRDIEGLRLESFEGEAGTKGKDAVVKERVQLGPRRNAMKKDPKLADDRMISGKLRKKAGRAGASASTVTVDGTAYAWSHRHGWLVWGKGIKAISVSVALKPERTRELILDFTIKVGAEDPTPPEARVARALEGAIRSALAAGWDPESRGRAFRFEVAESL